MTRIFWPPPIAYSWPVGHPSDSNRSPHDLSLHISSSNVAQASVLCSRSIDRESAAKTRTLEGNSHAGHKSAANDFIFQSGNNWGTGECQCGKCSQLRFLFFCCLKSCWAPAGLSTYRVLEKECLTNDSSRQRGVCAISSQLDSTFKIVS